MRKCKKNYLIKRFVLVYFINQDICFINQDAMEMTIVYIEIHVSIFFSSPEPLGSQGELIGWP